MYPVYELRPAICTPLAIANGVLVAVRKSLPPQTRRLHLPAARLQRYAIATGAFASAIIAIASAIIAIANAIIAIANDCKRNHGLYARLQGDCVCNHSQSFRLRLQSFVGQTPATGCALPPFSSNPTPKFSPFYDAPGIRNR